jgi:hypothetical protein
VKRRKESKHRYRLSWEWITTEPDNSINSGGLKRTLICNGLFLGRLENNSPTRDWFI